MANKQYYNISIRKAIIMNTHTHTHTQHTHTQHTQQSHTQYTHIYISIYIYTCVYLYILFMKFSSIKIRKVLC